ncbi:unnamed protein product [Microthlaspi erraticum]|uniref:Uncharacterized protein n=1 Tax=Microthlaspi erraticum TaxID=1685480 RepID=A0A6D2KVI8_9BRAS|nr:unnamed protein product [Microthlaspi erraticum]
MVSRFLHQNNSLSFRLVPSILTYYYRLGPVMLFLLLRRHCPRCAWSIPPALALPATENWESLNLIVLYNLQQDKQRWLNQAFTVSCIITDDADLEKLDPSESHALLTAAELSDKKRKTSNMETNTILGDTADDELEANSNLWLGNQHHTWDQTSPSPLPEKKEKRPSLEN